MRAQNNRTEIEEKLDVRMSKYGTIYRDNMKNVLKTMLKLLFLEMSFSLK